MLAEQVGLDRKSAGRVLTATIAANIEDMGVNSSTPWRVMSWTRADDAVGGTPAAASPLADSDVAALRADLEAALDLIRSALSRLV